MKENNECTTLVEKIIQGDISAFRELVEKFKKKIFYISFDILGDYQEAEDISQEVFIKIFRSINKFKKDAKMSTWIYQITVNTCIDAIRRKKAKPTIQIDEGKLADYWAVDSLLSAKISSPESSADASLLQIKIQEALNKISDRERAVFVMRHYNELSINEIADVMKISSGTVKSFLFRGLQKLRKELSFYQEKPSLEVGYD
jgi:RNA polymerase sigma-70 factor (ECF subfamily)